MRILYSNDRKVYDLSAGKSLPQWISDKKRRKLEHSDVDIRRRIELMQDFDMPAVSHTVGFSSDARYLFATGTYKPTVKCFDLEELSLKFKRGLDSDVVRLLVLSDDFEKFVLLEEERYLEFHTRYGRYFRMRTPRAGVDMAFCKEISELYIASSGDEIYRFNLMHGEFRQPLRCADGAATCCRFNEEHQLFVCGTTSGRVEAWDHRDRKCVATLDCLRNNGIPLELSYGEIAEVSSVAFRGALNLGVGLSSGHVLMYDLRSSRSFNIKDHSMGLPINRLDFVKSGDENLVLSMDERILKIWREDNGAPFAAVEPGVKLNDFCRYPNSGFLCFANEATKIHTYFIPSLGPAPKWCSHLESITEELEEVEQPAVYDDYKFVTKMQLEEIGLGHLVGTSVLRAYMHGYFMDARLYQQARTLTQPLAFEKYKKLKLQEYIEEERKIQIIKSDASKLPKVNKELASKLQAELSLDDRVKKKAARKAEKATPAEAAESLLNDTRFQSLFTNPDFEVDPESETFRQMMPKTKKLKERKKRQMEANARRAAANKPSTSKADPSDEDENEHDEEGDLQRRFIAAGDLPTFHANRSHSSALNFGGLIDSDEDEELM